MFVSNMEKQKILLKIDPLAWTETFHTGKGREEVLEIHDFKNVCISISSTESGQPGSHLGYGLLE